MASDRSPNGDVFRDGEGGGRDARRGLWRGTFRSDAPVLLAVAVGGGLGSLARYGVETVLQPGPFPESTFAVNVVGCLLIGVLMVSITDIWSAGRLTRPFLGVGVLGGFTTYSTFMLDLHRLGSGGNWLVAEAYLAASVGVGLLCVEAGIVGTRLLMRTRRRVVREDG